jgi:hypothetical protein
MPGVNASIRSLWARYRASTGTTRELFRLAIALAAAVFVLPVLIWMAGQLFLGDYVRDPAGATRGGLGALWLDYLRGLFRGDLGNWLALIGPYVIYTALRLSRWIVKM